jgi:alpha-beta hydrolase superfamily lysophospholipase
MNKMNRWAGAACAILLFSHSSSAESRANLILRGKTLDLHLYGPASAPTVVLSSGDLGWAGFVTHVAEFLGAHGYRVVGVNSKTYLANFTQGSSTLQPHDVPTDYRQLINYARGKEEIRPILAGISEGAGLSVLAASEREIKASVQGVLGLGLPNKNELGWRWQDACIWFTKKTPNEPCFLVADFISLVSPAPLAEIHSTHDEFLPLDQAKALFEKAGEPKRMWVVDAANHRFSDNRTELDQRLLEALAWLRSAR